MCDLGAYTTSFKGVIIQRPILILLLACNYFVSVRSMSTISKESENHLNANSNVRCAFIELSKELSCFCQNKKSIPKSEETEIPIQLTNLISEVPMFKSLNKMDIPSDSTIAADSLKEVRQIKISGDIDNSCSSLNLSLDFRQLSLPIDKLSIEDIKSVTIHDLIIRQNETLDISLKRINQSITVTGQMVCPDCLETANIVEPSPILKLLKSNTNKLKQNEWNTKPKVKIQIIDAGNISFDSFVTGMGYRSNVRVQMRNANSVEVKDSYFNDLPLNGLEIFNVQNVTIFHSEFYNGSTNSIVLNGGVKNVHVKDCLMDKHLLNILDRNSTDVYFRCTTSPDSFLSYETNEDLKDDPECVSTLSKWIGPKPTYGVESTGAIVLALISALLLIVAIGLLFLMHRTGRLDQYM